MDFIRAIREKNFTHIVREIPTDFLTDDINEEIAALKLEIVNYNKKVRELNEVLADKDVTKTETIIRIFHFFKENHNRLVNIFKESTRLATFYKQHNALHRSLLELQSQANQRLKINKHFIQWSNRIVSEPSLKGETNFISRTIPHGESSKALGYDESADYDNTPKDDKRFVINGEGIPLPPRLQKEALDPKHRAWGTMFPAIAHALREIHDTWAEGKKEDDLTVEIEFNERLKKIEESFEPTISTKTFWEQLDVEDSQWFNSFNKYLTPREALDYLVTTNDQKQLCLDGGSQLLDTNGKRYIFVMDRQGNLFISADSEYRDGGRIGHPAFTRGQAVACAGELVVVNGKITYINNVTGHYQTGGYSLHRVVSQLKARGVLADECKIQVNRDDDFIYRGEQNKYKLSYEEFDELYQRNMGDAQAAKLDLSEKPNPKRLLNCLKNINEYLGKRAGETSSFLTIFFNSYNGNDYYQRRSDFSNLLRQMNQSNNIDTIINTINENLPEFEVGLRKNYANLLKELQGALIEYKKYDSSVLAIDFVHETIASYANLYQSMDKHSQTVKTYNQQYQFFSNNDRLRSNIAAANAEYRFVRKDTEPEIKVEFAKDELLEQQEFKNISCLVS